MRCPCNLTRSKTLIERLTISIIMLHVLRARLPLAPHTTLRSHILPEAVAEARARARAALRALLVQRDDLLVHFRARALVLLAFIALSILPTPAASRSIDRA